MKNIHDILKELDACEPGLRWAKQYDTIEEIVANVQKGSWLLWLCTELDLPSNLIIVVKTRYLSKKEKLKADICREVLGDLIIDNVNIKMKNIHTILKELDAFNEFLEWAKQYDTIEEIVANVQIGDWLLWLGIKLSLPRNLIIVAKTRYLSKKEKLKADICRETLGQLIIKKINEIIKKK